ADPYIQALFSSQSFNRYAYVWNNPLRYWDPSGYWKDGSGNAVTDGSDKAIGNADYGGASSGISNTCSGSCLFTYDTGLTVQGVFGEDFQLNHNTNTFTSSCECLSDAFSPINISPGISETSNTSAFSGLSGPTEGGGGLGSGLSSPTEGSDGLGVNSGVSGGVSVGGAWSVEGLSQNLVVNMVFDAESFYSAYSAFNNGQTLKGIGHLTLGIVMTVNPLGKMAKVAKAVASRAAKRGPKIVDRDGDVVEIVAPGKNGDITMITGMKKSGDTLNLNGAHIDGLSPGKSSITELKDFARELGRQQGVKEVIVRGGRRTTGANPGKVPRPIRIKVD
ncbi:MAG: hypothetical protein GY751_03550, partial [Bacteroidetes bacterium]|nr:hypothetical protein [Bacteroidota bacterium]